MSFLLLFAMLPLLLLSLSDGSDPSPEPEDPTPHVLEGTDERDNLTGTAQSDLINAMEGNDYVSGLDGNDNISLSGGNDHGLGGRGDDTIFGGAGADVLEGGAGNDLSRGGDGNDILFDDTGHDTLCGDLGHDVLDARDEPAGTPDSADKVFGGFGYDTLIGDAGDTLSGGAWQDEFFVTTGGAPVVITDWEDGEPLTITVPVGQRDSVLTTRDSQDGHDLEVVYEDQVVAILSGQAGADVLPHLFVDTFLPDELIGTASHDVLLGGAGNDVMIGYGGDDHIDADGGDDTVYGGAGNDFVHLGAGNDVYEGYWKDHEAGPALGDIDEVHAGAGADTLMADGSSAVLFGDSGNDLLSARDHLSDQDLTPDRLLGGIGQDTLIGDAGDTLTGGSGADTIHVYAERENVSAPVEVEDFDPLLDTLAIHLTYAPSLPTPGGQVSFEVDALNDRVVVSVDGYPRLILNNTQIFDPKWVTVTVAS